MHHLQCDGDVDKIVSIMHNAYTQALAAIPNSLHQWYKRIHDRGQMLISYYTYDITLQ